MAEDAQEELAILFVPALVVLLQRAEEIKKQPLTEAEVLAIRDEAITMTVPASVAADMETARGYADVNPEDCWRQWQQVRTNLRL